MWVRARQQSAFAPTPSVLRRIQRGNLFLHRTPDVEEVVLRHRIIVNFEAQAEGVETDQVLLELLEKVPEKDEG